MARASEGGAEMIDVRRAAALVRRHPETVRRWVWSGRLGAERQGNRLLLSRQEVEALAAREGVPARGVGEWAERARVAREAAGAASDSSAAGLVIEDRAERSGPGAARARR